jgi:hypothetical protein
MPETTETFINTRATMLATVFLTRKPSMSVSRIDLGHVQLLASSLPRDDDSVKEFGVILWGTAKKLPNDEEATKHANTHWRGKHGVMNELPRFAMPVLTLLYSVEEDLGYYAWAWEPYIELPSDQPKLRKPDSLACKKIQSDSLDKIVAKVRNWHDALARIVFSEV